jgi:hypothetical protein
MVMLNFFLFLFLLHYLLPFPFSASLSGLPQSFSVGDFELLDHFYAIFTIGTAAFMHLDFLLQNKMGRVKLTPLKLVDDFLFVFAAGHVKDQFFPGERMCFVKGARGHFLGFVEHY